MSGFQLIANLTQSLAWPLAVVIAALVLRKPLAHLITKPAAATGEGGTVRS